jgi:hypothetical protein
MIVYGSPPLRYTLAEAQGESVESLVGIFAGPQALQSSTTPAGGGASISFPWGCPGTSRLMQISSLSLFLSLF